MNSMGVLRVFIFISAVGITYVMAAPSTPKEETPQVPVIEDCDFVDAYAVTCWWKRPPDDDKTIYRLGHLSSSYHPDENDEKYCDSVHSRVTDHGVEIEECGFEKASLYQTFTFWVEVVTVVDDNYYPTGVKSQTVIFTAATSAVKLTVPPQNLNIDEDGQFLTWSEPEREGSLLLYVTSMRDLLYKVECRNHSSTMEEKWEECYRGYESEFPVSHFLPGVSYELRVLASLDYANPKDNKEDEREWSDPSDILVYKVPAPPESTEPAITLDSEVEIAAIVAPAVIIFAALMIVGGFLMHWKGQCCFDIKSIKPSAFIELDAKSDETNPSETALLDDFSNRTEERIHPVTMSDEFDWIVNDLRHKNGGTYTITITNEMGEDDIKRYFLRSFNPDNPRSSMQDETRSNVSDSSDVIRMEMLAKQKQKFQSKRSLDEESIQYMKLVANDAGLPTYTLTDSDGKRESLGSQESIDTEYVMEYTAVDPTSMPSVSYSHSKTPQSQRDHPKNCYIAEMLEKSPSEFPYGSIPDYVMQTSVSYEDFARTMTSFLHTLTHAEHDKGSDDVTTKQQHCTTELSSDCNLQSHLTNHGETMSRDLEHCDGRHQCYDSEDEHSTHTSRKDNNKACGFQPDDLSTTKSKAVLSRSGSGSLPSIDSGYSAETPEIS